MRREKCKSSRRSVKSSLEVGYEAALREISHWWFLLTIQKIQLSFNQSIIVQKTSAEILVKTDIKIGLVRKIGSKNIGGYRDFVGKSPYHTLNLFVEHKP